MRLAGRRRFGVFVNSLVRRERLDLRVREEKQGGAPLPTEQGLAIVVVPDPSRRLVTGASALNSIELPRASRGRPSQRVPAVEGSWRQCFEGGCLSTRRAS